MREKSTHIDQLLKERESDRDDMQTQSMLYQKNVSLVIMRVAVLLFSLLDLLDLRNFNLCVVSIKKSPSPEVEEQIGRWAEMVKRRNLQVVDLRREFQGWNGNHERHCILHDVFLA